MTIVIEMYAGVQTVPFDINVGLSEESLLNLLLLNDRRNSALCPHVYSVGAHKITETPNLVKIFHAALVTVSHGSATLL